MEPVLPRKDLKTQHMKGIAHHDGVVDLRRVHEVGDAIEGLVGAATFRLYQHRLFGDPLLSQVLSPHLGFARGVTVALTSGQDHHRCHVALPQVERVIEA